MCAKTWRQQLGEAGELAVSEALEALGWRVSNLNDAQQNTPNVDLLAARDGARVFIQVKAYNTYGWISGGGLNEKIANGAPLFNKVADRQTADFIVFLSPSAPTAPKALAVAWRFFVTPTHIAEALFRAHIDGVMNKPKRDGTRRKPVGAVQDWVGPGAKPNDWGPDLHEEWARYEGAFGGMGSEPGGNGR